MNKERVPGYYWVKLDGEWLIGEYKTSWYFCDPMLDYAGGFDDDQLEEIDERRIEREEGSTIFPDLTPERDPDYKK